MISKSTNIDQATPIRSMMSEVDNKEKNKGGQPSASEETAAPFPDMELCQKIHRLTTLKASSSDEHLPELQSQVFQQIASELENPSLYKHLRHQLYGDDVSMNSVIATVIVNDEVLREMEEKLEKHLEELEGKVAVAKESAGDMEVMEARVAIARFAAKSLSKERALEAYQKVLDLPKISSGKKIDALMESARVASFYGDTAKADDLVERAEKLTEDGGDWDRRNRLKVYRSLQRLLHRDTEAAATMMLDCIATFSCSEICTYPAFIGYAILSNMLHLPRPQLKKKIIDGPEVLSVAKEIPVILKLVQSYYDCEYKNYLHAMVEVEAVLLADRYLQPHAPFWMRELHILAYKQFLDSYQSVTLQAMAQAFGVSTDFIDYHASRFIAANRLSAKIDKYGGVVVTNRPDLKNAQYREMIQKGDHLLNRIQKLSRVVDL